MKRFLTHIGFLGFVVFFMACEKRNPDPIPNCTVSLVIHRDNLDSDLAAGRMKTFNSGRGYAGCNGVVVINLGNDEFLAFERYCPNDWRYDGVVVKHQNLAQEMPNHFECNVCKTKFNILDGQPMSGAVSRFPMRAYKVTKRSAVEFFVHN
jgi:nitrite reductase/ring-hydroxylating ferredoxin subunit